MMLSNLRLSSSASPWTLTAADRMLLKRVALGELDAVGSLVDRYADSVYSATDSFHLTARQADEVAEEVIRRLAFEAPRFVARPERVAEWFQRTLKECLGAVVLRGNAPLDSRTMSVAASRFSEFLNNGSLANALSYLNSQTPFRFTAIYRIDGLSISNLYLFDREHGLGRDESVSPVADTFCVWIHETLSVVQMTDSLRDPRAANHPKREQVRSYCGGPIKGAFGQLLGTICHFDVKAHDDLVDTMPVLAEIGPLLASLIDRFETLPATTRQLQHT